MSVESVCVYANVTILLFVNTADVNVGAGQTANWYDDIFPRMPLEIAAADTLYIPVVSVDVPDVAIVVAESVVLKVLKPTNVVPDPPVIVVFTPVILLFVVVKLPNDGVTFVVGFTRVTLVVNVEPEIVNE